jgi:toxin-antitoxin system PIN domain toxin
LIALDTNILIFARREEATHHTAAKRLFLELVEGSRPWAIPWPCIYEFLRVITHPRVFSPPTPIVAALDDLDRLFETPSLTMLGEGPGHPAHLRRMMEAGAAKGNLAHDAHIAALLREHGVREIWTTDRDFTRFPGIAVRNPFVGDEVHETRVRYRSGARRKRPTARPSSSRPARG